MKLRNINWTNHFIELIVVVIGITIAFMLNNWRENYKDRQLEQKYLSSFRDEIELDLKELEYILNDNQQRLRRATQLLNMIKGQKMEPDSVMVIFGDMSKLNSFTPALSTYESITSSGKLGIISNYYLKEDLVRYYRKFDEKKLIDEVYNAYVNEFVIPFVFEHVDFLSQQLVKESALRSHKFRNLAGGYYQLVAQNVDFYQGILEIGKALNSRLDKEIREP